MTRLLHRWSTIPITARVLLIAALVAGALTVAAAAREPAMQPAAQPGAGATVNPTAPGPNGGNLPGAQDVAFAEMQEGAIPIPSVEPQPPPGESRYQDGSRFAMPLAAWTAVTDRFGAPRGPGLMHGGIDLALDDYRRSPVYAACTGTVTTAEYSSTYGYYAVVDCGDGWSTLYAHMSEVRAVPGLAVTPETVVGISGSTGFSTGEHLHFEIMWRGARVNPEDYLDFKIAPGTPLSSGPLVFGRGSGGGATASGGGPAVGGAPSETPATEDPTATATATATKVAPTATATSTPTATPTFTPTPTPMPPTPTRTPTPRPVLR